jgi:small subunit ribosomal protein S35
MIEKYFDGDEEALEDVMEALIRRRVTGKHDESDAELLEELKNKPVGDIPDEEFDEALKAGSEEDSDEDYSGDLCNARDMVIKKLTQDEFFNMDDHKWDDMVQEGLDHKFLKDTKECEQILYNMLNWEKILPAGIKEKIEKRFNEIGEMVERGEIEVAEGYELYKEFEEKMVLEVSEQMAAEAPQFDEDVKPDNKKDLDDPPGEGPILRWHSRCVFAPGDDSWHPKNRKVKMGVTVKELGLSKHQFRRLRELVGKRYNPGKDELMITSERFEHREENRKDCLRTLFKLIEEAGKADKLVKDAVAAYLKENGEANPMSMARD